MALQRREERSKQTLAELEASRNALKGHIERHEVTHEISPVIARRLPWYIC